MKHIFSRMEGSRPLLPAAPSPLWKSRFPSPSLNLDAHLNASIPKKRSRGSDFYLHSDHASDFCLSVVFESPVFPCCVGSLRMDQRGSVSDPHPSRHFVNEFVRSLVVIEWFGWKMPQGCRCQPYAGAYSQRAGVGEWTSKLPRHVHGCNSPVCVLLCLHTLVDMARQDSVWL